MCYLINLISIALFTLFPSLSILTQLGFVIRQSSFHIFVILFVFIDGTFGASTGNEDISKSSDKSSLFAGNNLVIAICIGILAMITLTVAIFFVVRACGKSDSKSSNESNHFNYGGINDIKGDRKLAQSAQMYHYEYQKKKMVALERANEQIADGQDSPESDDENQEGDNIVYECPGLAPTGELEVRNPMFQKINEN